MKPISIYPSGENALTVSFGDHVNEKLNRNVFLLYYSVLEKSIPFCLDIIPAYTTVTFIYDLIGIRKLHGSAFEWIKREVERAVENCNWNQELPSRKIQLPVCYESDFAPDCKRVASQKKISVEKLIELHMQRSYRVFMIGFLPGFAYMGPVDKRIATPRLDKPRTHVAAGSVGIAGEQTGIYPMDSPGGWNIIGKTPVKIFAQEKVNPVLLHPGDEVKFIPITKEQLDVFDQVEFEQTIG